MTITDDARNTVTDAQVAAVSEYMYEDIGQDDWPGAGDPSGWGDADWDRWSAAGNAAVLARRADIEAGNVTAGQVWCAATGGLHFHFSAETEAYLHTWFVDHRDHLDRLLAGVVPVAPTPNPPEPHAFARGDLAALDGRLVKVGASSTANRISDVWWFEDTDRRQDGGVSWDRLVWMEPGVARLRRRTDYTSTPYGHETDLVPGEEYVFDRVYSVNDRAIHVRLPSGYTQYRCHSDFEPVPSGQTLAHVRRPVVDGVRQDVWMPDGSLALVLPESRITDGTIVVYERVHGTWRHNPFPITDLDAAQEGDTLQYTDGSTGTYVRNGDDAAIIVRVNDEDRRWQRTDIRWGGVPAAPKVPVENLFVTVAGVQYVRKDVVDEDLARMTSTMHHGATQHSLCGVYDEVQVAADRHTQYLKFGGRFASWDVEVLELVPVLRTIRVERVLNEESARTQATQVARDYPLPAPASPRDRETVRLQRGVHMVTVQGTTRITT